MTSPANRKLRDARSALQRAQHEDAWHIRIMLRLVAQLAPIYERLGVDADSLHELLATKLRLDNRRRERGRPSGALNNVGFGLMLAFNAFLGVLMGIAANFVEDPFLYLSGVTSLTLLMLLFPLLADFSSILLDTSDIELLAPLPISDRTLVAVRVTHLLGYVGLLVFALGFGPFVIGMFAYNPLAYVPIVVLALLQATLLAVAGVVAFYLFALKSLDLTRFRDALVYVQGGAFLVFYAGLQLGPRVAERLGFVDFAVEHPELLFALPTTAAGALLRIAQGEVGAHDWALCFSGFGITFLVVCMASFLAREGIVTRLAFMESSGGRALRKAPAHGFGGRLSKYLANGPLERAGWMFLIALCRSDRSFKMRSMPNFAFIAVPFLMFFLRGEREDSDFIIAVLPYAPYMFLLIIPSTWQCAAYGDSWEGRWVLDELDGAQVEEFTRGAMKATIARYLFVPLFILSVVAAVVVPPSGWLDWVFASALVVIASLWCLPKYGAEPPFTQKLTQHMGANNMLLALFVVSIAWLLGGAQFALSRVPFAIPVLAPLAAIGAVLAWRLFARRGFRRKRGARARRRTRSSSARG